VAKIEYDESCALEPCLIVRTSTDCKDSIIILNSSNEHYSQITFFNFSTITSVQLKPIFLSVLDSFPVDKNGRTEILMIDAQWSANRLFVVVLFAPNYFCILSRLGQPLNVLCDGSIRHFPVLPISSTLYLKVNIDEKNVRFFSSTSTVIVGYESKINLFNVCVQELKSC
jgi:hypothetical protein